MTTRLPPTLAGTDDAEIVDLHHHGDEDLDPHADGQLDLAVNVRLPRPPAWLRARLHAALDGLAAYPRQHAAIAAVAARHRRPADEVLLTNGAAEAFTLMARTLRPRRAVCVHPSFTAPEAALRQAGHDVERVLLPPGRAGQPDQPDGSAAPAAGPRAAGQARPGPRGRRGVRRRRSRRAGQPQLAA
jgi:histidinol-phosphate aminotransferase